MKEEDIRSQIRGVEYDTMGNVMFNYRLDYKETHIIIMKEPGAIFPSFTVFPSNKIMEVDLNPLTECLIDRLTFSKVLMVN